MLLEGLGVKLNDESCSLSLPPFHRLAGFPDSDPRRHSDILSREQAPYSSRYHPKPERCSGLNNESNTRVKEKGPGKLLLIIRDTCLTVSFPRLPFYAEQLLG